MKRFHVHLHVDDLAASTAFYSRLFGQEPARSEADYAKWMLDDPRLNFAISTRGTQPGIDHLGIQADTDEELAQLRASGESASAQVLDESETTCCYARSDKHWITDPQGIAWEHFRTLENIPVFHEASPSRVPARGSASGSANDSANDSGSNSVSKAACCAPAPRGKPVAIAVKPAGACC